MKSTLPFDQYPAIEVSARRNDPDTSHAAAASMDTDRRRVTRSMNTVVRIMTDHGDMTDFTLIEHWRHYWNEGWSHSLPSKARHWARQAGLVKRVGYGKHQGRKVILWGLGKDEEYLQHLEFCPMCHRLWNRAKEIT